MIRAGITLSIGELEHIFEQLDEALILENERSAAALKAAADAYRAAPFRPSALAGTGYPSEREALREYLDGYLDDLSGETAQRPLRGLVSPHIDYQRGGPVYAQIWSRAAEAVREAEVVVILGTDHNGGNGRITLTRQHYATPYGVLPTELESVDTIAEAVGEVAAFEEELHHLYEHSIELTIVWLHHIRGGEPCAVVPVLTGSFFHFVQGEGSPAEDPTIASAVEALQIALHGRAALVVVAGDLAHIGPAFDGRPVENFGKAQLKVQDKQLISLICDGDAEGLFQAIRADRDQRNVCGLPPIYVMLRVLGDARGELAGYHRCPADVNNTSFVSICGIALE
jgi:AmmeMemoRadiSam system protein B